MSVAPPPLPVHLGAGAGAGDSNQVEMGQKIADSWAQSEQHHAVSPDISARNVPDMETVFDNVLN